MSIDFNREQSFDFFKEKDIHIDKNSSKSMQYFAMAMYTFSKIVSTKFVLTACIGTAVIIGSTTYLNDSQKSKDIEKQQALMTEIKEKSEKEMVQIKVDKELNKLIANVPDGAISGTLAYINEVQSKEVKKLNTLYWSIFYMKKHEDVNFDMAEVNAQIQKTIFEVNNHYLERKKEIVLTYYSLKKNNAPYIKKTYDNQSAAQITFNWLTFYETKSEILTSNTEQMYTKAMSYLKNPVELANYLEKNKYLIENTPVAK